ncbi:hypothetical protein N9A94_03305 [Akkermansiaceae bacterium]|nr:hypothetical protein [Akkermansiaceae bacterium]
MSLILLVLGTLAAKHFYDLWQVRTTGKDIITLCQLPPLPEELEILHAENDPSDDDKHVDVTLTIVGPTKALTRWLEEVDAWELDYPVRILRYKIRESEMRSRMDFSAEILLK